MADVDMAMGLGEDADALSEPLIQEVPTDDAEPMQGVARITEINGADIKEEKPSPNPNEGEHIWVIPGFSSINVAHQEKMHSEEFEVGGFPWDILLFPRGNKDVRGQGLSLYLNVSDFELAPIGWTRRAVFKLTVVNHMDPSLSVSKEATHDFCLRGVDWGFTTFMPLKEVLDKSKGFLRDDKLEIRARVRVEKTDSFFYDSKKETGFVGLKNQGATCYMNSLLQFLYNINYFRQAVYHMPTSEEDDPLKSIPLALQSLFYKLQFGDSSVSTKDLTKSFGWDTYDAFMQHDVQELNRVLQEKLEDKMKGTKVEGTIARLFEGHMHMFIECINVDVKSTRRESYMDLQLDVKGAKNIYDSFDKYCEVEVMDGQNQYKTDDHGLQDARKGVLFDSFPPVLQLQLKRFEYDFQRDMMVKINDRYEFPDELDLDAGDGRLLSANADRSVRNLYALHSVLVHSGGVHGGHYYAFIRPDGKRWLKFDDERVSVEDAKKAMQEQFGGEDENPPATGFNTFKFTKYSNAYMLVYIRKSDWDQIMCEVSSKDIQEHVRLRLEAEKEEKERRKREKQEAHLYTCIRVVTDADLAAQIGATLWFDLVDHEKVKQYRVKKQTPLREFREQLAADMGVPAHQQRLWTFAKRQNNTLRPAKALTEADDGVRVCDIKDGGPLTNSARLGGPLPLPLFLETPLPPQAELPPLSKQTLLLFLKLYDPHSQTLRYAGRIFASKVQRFQDLVPLLLHRTGLPGGTPLLIFEEVKFEPQLMCDLQAMAHTLAQAQLEDGDILCLQAEPTEEERASLPYPTVKDYLEWVRKRITVTFRRLEHPKEEGIKVELSRDLDYDGVCEALYQQLKERGEAEKLGLDDPQRLRFTQQQPFLGGGPKPQPLKWQGFTTLREVMIHFQAPLETLFWESLDLPLSQLERLKTLRVYYHGEATEHVSTHDVRLPKESTIADVITALRALLPADKCPERLRLLEVFYSKIYKLFSPEDRIDAIDDHYWQVRAEAVPSEEVDPPSHSRRIHVYHFSLQNNNVANFGSPFLLQIGDDEVLGHIRQRIQAKLGVADEEFAKWKFAFINNLRQPEYLTDDDVVAARFPRQTGTQGLGSQEVAYLGMEHTDTGPRQRHHNNRGYSQYERPVKIYN